MDQNYLDNLYREFFRQEKSINKIRELTKSLNYIIEEQAGANPQDF